MISREWLRQNPDLYRKALLNRRANIDLDQYLAVEVQRREIITNVEMLKARKNAASQEIAKLKKQQLDADEQIAGMKRVGDDIAALEQKLSDVEESLRSMELVFPNVPDGSVPVGPDETANRIERVWGEQPRFDFQPLQHFDIGERLGIIDFQRAAKITGARFAVLFGAGAELERALTAFMLDVHTKKHGYTEVLPPFMVNAESLLGTGQLPKFEEDLFKLQGEKSYYLIPTAEVPVTNLLRDEIVSEDELPISYCAYTPCFRSEAGSYGKDTRGLIRQHQFDKVELVKFSKPDESWQQLERLTADAAEILELLGLCYRVVTLSTGDMGFGSAKTYDIEVWLPGQNTFREISSCTNFTDFQARRANIRYKGATTKTTFVHTLNGSGLAVGRTLVAVLENYQQADGTVLVPPALRPYMSGAERITARK